MSKKAQTVITLIDDVTLDDDPTSATSSSLSIDAWSHFLLFIDIDSTGTPTDVQIIVEFSDDGGTTWYQYMNDFFGDLRYEDGATADGIKECLSGMCLGQEMRVRAVATGTDADNKFDVTIKAQLANV